MGDLEIIKLDPPLLSDAHLGVREKALRPFRKEGPRVEKEELEYHKIFHHYGHGSAGWSISPATRDVWK